MKKLVIGTFAALFLLVGCGQKKETAASTTESSQEALQSTLPVLENATKNTVVTKTLVLPADESGAQQTQIITYKGNQFLSLTIQQKRPVSEDLKNYILSEEGENYVSFEENHLKDYFISYLPRQSYEYYYNNLYNNIALKNEVNLKYINISKTLLNNGEYQEAFDIVKSIIEAANDTEILSKWEELTNCLPVIGMLLRIIYRKANAETINDINIWINKLEKNKAQQSG